jgi:hypothetical protein
VGVDVGDDREAGLSTELPEWAVAAAIKDDDAGLQRSWVEVVVEDEAGRAPPSPLLGAQ